MSANATSSGQVQATTSTQASSAPTTSSTSDAPTSATPTTEATTASPAQPSTAQTSVATPAATSSPLASSSSLAPSAASTATNSSVFTTQVATTLLSTDAAGSTIYITTTAPEVATSSASSGSGSSGGSSHTAAIVGGVVGGVVGLAILVFLFFCIRRRARKDEFDGNFDPDRIGGSDDREGTLPQVDLAEEVTPFPQSYTDQGGSSMRQFGESPSVAIPSSSATSGQASTEFYPHGAVADDAQPRPFMQPGAGPPPSGAYLPPINMYGTGPADWHSPRPGASPPPSTASNNTSSARAAKEREALGRGEQGVGLGLATQPEAPEGSEVVVVHQDAGRAPTQDHVPPPREIPPAYDSIRRD